MNRDALDCVRDVESESCITELNASATAGFIVSGLCVSEGLAIDYAEHTESAIKTGRSDIGDEHRSGRDGIQIVRCLGLNRDDVAGPHCAIRRICNIDLAFL